MPVYGFDAEGVRKIRNGLMQLGNARDKGPQRTRRQPVTRRPGRMSGDTSTGGCDCSTCYTANFGDVDFGAALRGMRTYKLTLDLEDTTLTFFINWQGSYWESDDITFECGPSDSRTVRFKLTAASTAQGAMLLEMIDQAGPTTLLSWVNYSQGWVPTCSITLGIVPQVNDCKRLDPPPCKVCVDPFLRGGCACAGKKWAWLIDISDVTTGCGDSYAGAEGTFVLDYLTTASSPSQACYWRLYSPDGQFRYQVQLRYEVLTGHEYAIKVIVMLDKWNGVAWPPTEATYGLTWGYIFGAEEHFCDQQSYVLSHSATPFIPPCQPASDITVTLLEV